MEILERSGSKLETAGEGVFACALGDELARFLGRPMVTFTFQRRAAMNGRADLAAPGSWLHDQLLRFARDRGRVARAYLGPRPGLDAKQLAAERLSVSAEDLASLERRYGSLLVFTFRIFYYSDPAAEVLLHLGYDAERRRISRRGLPRLLADAQPVANPNGYHPAPAPDVGAAFSAVWTAVEDEVELRVRGLEEAGRTAYEARIHVVENYYRQLLAEEAKPPRAHDGAGNPTIAGRATALPGDRGHRLHAACYAVAVPKSGGIGDRGESPPDAATCAGADRVRNEM